LLHQNASKKLHRTNYLEDEPGAVQIEAKEKDKKGKKGKKTVKGSIKDSDSEEEVMGMGVVQTTHRKSKKKKSKKKKKKQKKSKKKSKTKKKSGASGAADTQHGGSPIHIKDGSQSVPTSPIKVDPPPPRNGSQTPNLVKRKKKLLSTEPFQSQTPGPLMRRTKKRTLSNPNQSQTPIGTHSRKNSRGRHGRRPSILDMVRSSIPRPKSRGGSRSRSSSRTESHRPPAIETTFTSNTRTSKPAPLVLSPHSFTGMSRPMSPRSLKISVTTAQHRQKNLREQALLQAHRTRSRNRSRNSMSREDHHSRNDSGNNNNNHNRAHSPLHHSSLPILKIGLTPSDDLSPPCPRDDESPSHRQHRPSPQTFLFPDQSIPENGVIDSNTNTNANSNGSTAHINNNNTNNNTNTNNATNNTNTATNINIKTNNNNTQSHTNGAGKTPDPSDPRLSAPNIGMSSVRVYVCA